MKASSRIFAANDIRDFRSPWKDHARISLAGKGKRLAVLEFNVHETVLAAPYM